MEANLTALVETALNCLRMAALLDKRLLVEFHYFYTLHAAYENKVYKDVSILVKNLIFRCCTDKVQDAGDNKIHGKFVTRLWWSLAEDTSSQAHGCFSSSLPSTYLYYAEITEWCNL